MGRTHYFDYTPPGVLLNDQLLGRGLSQEDLAGMCGYSTDKIKGIIRGDEHVDEMVARQLELSLGIDADLWLNIESNYISHLRRGLEVQYRELAKRGYVPVLSRKELPTQRIPNLMAFFNVDCDDALVAWRRRMKATADAVAYRHSPKFDSDPVAVAAWLRMGSFDAPAEVPEFSEDRFKSALDTIRTLTSQEPSMWDETIEEATQLCHESGVVLSVVKPLKDVALDGAFRWLDDGKKGIIQLSARWKKDDRFWFSLFHEAGHVLLSRENAQINKVDVSMWESESVVEDSDADNTHEREVAEQERQVDTWAAEFLIPSEEWDRFRNHRRYTPDAIRSFADDMGIAPGIVAGRLQKETGRWNSTRLNRLKFSLKWEDSEGSPPRLRADVG